MREVKAIVRPSVLDEVLAALAREGLQTNVTLFHVNGWDPREPPAPEETSRYGLAQKTVLELVVPDRDVDAVVSTIVASARTGRAGDGKVFVSSVLDAVKVRSGERGVAAL